MTQPLCGRCKEKSRVIGHNYCKDCRSEANRRYRQGKGKAWVQSAKGKQKIRESRERRSLERREYVFAYLREHPCVDCQETDLLVLEFDHVHPTQKRKGVMEMMFESQEAVEAEIAKCVVRCANCHTRHHRLQEKCARLEFLP